MGDRRRDKAPVVAYDSSSSDEEDMTERRFLFDDDPGDVEMNLGINLGSGAGSASDGGGRRRENALLDAVQNMWDLARGLQYPGRDMVDFDSIWGVDKSDALFGPGNFDRLPMLPRLPLVDRREIQPKRPKVLGLAEICNTGASSSGAGSSRPPAIVDGTQFSLATTENETNICPMSNDYDGPKPSVDEVASSTTDNEDLVIRLDLTEDLLLLIFSFLGPKDLCKAGATCKQWQVASMHNGFWRCLNFENTEISRQNFESICERYPNATEVNLFGVRNSEALAKEAMSSLRRLKSLILGKGQLGDAFFRAVTRCRTLKSLSICDSSLGNGVQEITINHEKLRQLRIVKCRVLRVSVRCPQLKSLTLRRSNMSHVLVTCPQLHELDIASCHKLSDVGIRSAATSCPLLASLDMSSCSCISDETLREIAHACPNLCVLNASYCPNITLESVRLPMLIDLKLHSCEGITSASMSAIFHSRMLEALQLDNCGLLTSVSLDLLHLRSISLVHCRKFVELNLQSPVLSSVKVSNCSALHHLSITSKSLQRLVLQKLESLVTLNLQCPILEKVDLSDCESLENSVCEVFSDGGGCPMLSSLILDNCESLIVVRLNCSFLASLSLVGCHGLNILELSCPNLQNVSLAGCGHLERALFSPVDLESLNLGICPKLSTLQIESPRMLVLELKGCGVLSQASINCPSLMSLDASFCRQFMDDSLSTTATSCQRVESLVLSSCISVGYDGLFSLRWLQRLTSLDLSYTFLTNLQPVFDSCLQLVILNISACKYLSSTSLDALYKEGALPALRELDLSYTSIGQSAIAELLASCTNLVNVNLNGCINMHDLIVSSNDHYSSEMPIDSSSSNLMSVENNDEAFENPDRSLEILNCIGCQNIKKVIIPTTARCFYLSKLNLNLSTNLKKVDISCINLSSLNLSNCSSLEILKLDCPRLMNLQLLGCSMLEPEVVEAAISRCYILETLDVQSCAKIPAVFVETLRMACPSPNLKRIHYSLLD